VHAGKRFLLLQDPFGLWCSYHAPKDEAVQEPNLYENMRVRTDRSNRDDWIYQHCKNVINASSPDDAERFRNTLRAMVRGADGIIGASLWDLRTQDGLWGGVNLLMRIDGIKSVFGDYCYRIVQLKRAHDLKEHYAMQTTIMNAILSEIQGFYCADALFVLKDKEQSLHCESEHEKAMAHLDDWRAIKAGTLVPEAKKPPKAALAPWRVFANKYVFEHKDLILLPHLNAQQRAVLRGAGLKNYDEVADAGQPRLKELLKDPLTGDEKAASETYKNAMAFKLDKPISKGGPWPLKPKKRNLYFDFEATETFTKNSVSFIYLIGVWDKEADKFTYFIAKNEAEEEVIFKQFADFMGDPQEAALYHWTEYEVKKMQTLAKKYPAVKYQLESLLSACIDLKIVVEKAFYLPSPSLSLKAAAPAFGFNWRQSDVGAMDSMVYFTRWLQTGEQPLLDKVLMYNEDDCKAMLFVEDYLKTHEVVNL
ncbi:MAG: TM0106 family RecB-like putative nuclease, partial [Elusimicrobiota bacterium]|nr:TM0106 family RecB-like putative nuclease [Elusimicrobiota bacterium]